MSFIVKILTVISMLALSLFQLLSGAGAESATAPAARTPQETKSAGEQGGQPPLNATRAAREEKAIQDARRQQLSEKEATLAAKELELKKMSARLDAQLKQLEESKKQLDELLKQKKKGVDAQRKRMLTLLKKMRPEQAGQYLAKMEDQSVISILNELDNKMVLKLIPFLNQPMVLKWIKENLSTS